MNSYRTLLKSAFLLLAFFITNFAFAQNTPSTGGSDNSFSLFLMVIACVFISVMIGAAIIGAIIASLILFCLFTLLAFGALSASVAVGLYKRSYAAGFKSFLIILFTVACSSIGGIGLVLATKFLHLPLSTSTASVTGVLSGICGGYLMALASYRTIQVVTSYVLKRIGMVR